MKQHVPPKGEAILGPLNPSIENWLFKELDHGRVRGGAFFLPAPFPLYIPNHVPVWGFPSPPKDGVLRETDWL